MEVQGIPPESTLALAGRRNHFFDENNKPKKLKKESRKPKEPNSKNLKDMMKGASD